MIEGVEITYGIIKNAGFVGLILTLGLIYGLYRGGRFILNPKNGFYATFNISPLKLQIIYILGSFFVVVIMLYVIREIAINKYIEELKNDYDVCMANNRNCESKEKLLKRLGVDANYNDGQLLIR
jgi:hypothetical protein